MALLGGCTPTPGEVADTGLTTSSSSTGSTSGSSTGAPTGSMTEGSATVASVDDTGTSSGGPATTLPLDATTTDEGTTEGRGSSSSGGMMMESSGTSTTGVTDGCHPLLAEVLYDPMGNNGGKQWIKLYNPCAADLELLGASLGWGGADYAANGLDLEGTIPPGECFLIGGPMSNADNFIPMYDLALDLSGDLQVSGSDADGVALFAELEASVAAEFGWTSEELGNWRSKLLISIRDAARDLDLE